MKELEEMILEHGEVLEGDILKVGKFLNQKVDIKLLKNMAKEIKEYFGEGITKVLTIEASGLPFATAIAMEYDCEMVFAKKSKTSNLSDDLLTSEVESYTQRKNNTIFVPCDYITSKDKVLIADDFLAKGNALKGLINICDKANAEIVGVAIEIEKEYQHGGNELRDKGYKIYSLASIKAMEDKNIIFN